MVRVPSPAELDAAYFSSDNEHSTEPDGICPECFALGMSMSESKLIMEVLDSLQSRVALAVSIVASTTVFTDHAGKVTEILESVVGELSVMLATTLKQGISVGLHAARLQTGQPADSGTVQ